MREHTMAITSNDRLTIPVAIHRALQIQTGDRVTFIRDGDRVVLRRADGSGPIVAGWVEAPSMHPGRRC